MKSKIEKQIISDVESALAEIDIDGVVKQYTNSMRVKEIVDQMVKDKIAQVFQEKILFAYRKQERLIDAWADSKLTALLKELGVY